MLEIDGVQDGEDIGEVLVRYGHGMRKDKTIILKTNNLGQENDIRVQGLRFKYTIFLENAIENATFNNLA